MGQNGESRFMAFYEDLSSCNYFGDEFAHGLVAVGWLEKEHNYSKDVNIVNGFLNKLFDLLINPWQFPHSIEPGSHECDFCLIHEQKRTIVLRGSSVDMGATELFVPWRSNLFVSPSLILHYIDAHGYTPPKVFQEAVLACPMNHSMEYLKAIKSSAPQGFLKKTIGP